MIYLILFENKDGEKELLTVNEGSLFAFVSEKIDEGFLQNFSNAEVLPVAGDGSLVLHNNFSFEEMAYSMMFSRIPISLTVKFSEPSSREKVIKWLKKKIGRSVQDN